ncbi:MAG: Ig domain-containing protein [Ruminococcaceae bacterium]|nr:Ig domain-containing protein [Oscillospiraceae bacterium]
MKKTVILILILLPIVLLVTISFAGRILSTYQHIAVERIFFADEEGKELGADATLVISTGETVATTIQILPELAADKRVQYTTSDESVCTVDDTGTITGVGAGSAIIMVKTVDGNKTAMLHVSVKADGVTGVMLTPETLEMKLGESDMLQAVVSPYAALDKSVTYTSSDPAVVTVSASGKVSAVGVGTAIVTVTTKDGGFTDTCTVIVVNDTPPLRFDFTGASGIIQSGTGYICHSAQVALADFLLIDESQLGTAEIHFRVISGSGATVDDNGVLTFTQADVVVVEAYAGNIDDPISRVEVRLAWLS